ncbi:MAG: exonuclease SbcCD subunit D [Arthrobacter sp.]|jgi:exonuclease SbcD|nr:exonuclease SbcCD subunit D [Arthrobacter sp.]
MRLLHTSDWHLGRTFHGSSLLAEQELAMDRVVQAVKEHGVDAVLIAGDVYDRALPAVDVVRLFDRTLARLVEAGAQVIVSSGNHDSAVRLGFGGALMESAGVHLRTRLEDVERPVVLREEGQEVLVYALPYLEPRLVGGALGVEEGGHTPVLRAALERVGADAAARAERAGLPVRTVVMAHVFAAGGEASESERPLAVGELDRVPATLFEPFDYAALGHLHGAQAPLPHVRYSGSPLPYSFSEASQSKVGLLVDLAAGAPAEVTALPWPPPRPLARLRGTLEFLLTDPGLEDAEAAWCQFTLTDPERPERPMERLRARFPHALVLRWEPERERGDAALGYRDRVRRDAADPALVARGFVDHVRQRALNPEEDELLTSLVHAAQLEENAK